MIASPDATATTLQGRRVLVAEDEYLIAQELVAMLFDAGAEAIGPVGDIGGALQLAQAGPAGIDAALLDVNLHGETVWPVVDILVGQGVPVVLTTGYDSDAIPADYAALPRCEKPVTMREVAQALAKALKGVRA